MRSPLSVSGCSECISEEVVHMRSYGDSTVVAVGELVPYMLDAVIREGFVVAVGSVAHPAVAVYISRDARRSRQDTACGTRLPPPRQLSRIFLYYPFPFCPFMHIKRCPLVLNRISTVRIIPYFPSDCNSKKEGAAVFAPLHLFRKLTALFRLCAVPFIRDEAV